MEFKDIITSSLENSGFLDRIRAELRGEIFENVKKDGFYLEESKEIKESDLTSVLVFKDFLEKASAEHSLKTFSSEAVVNTDKLSLDDTLKKLELKRENSEPAIYGIIKKFNEQYKLRLD